MTVWEGLSQAILLPRLVRISINLVTSVISGTLVYVTGLSNKSEAGRRATMEFFEPEGVIWPEMTCPPLILMSMGDLLYVFDQGGKRTLFIYLTFLRGK